MTYNFGDGFDLYTNSNDAQTYWDPTSAPPGFGTGRFTGAQAYGWGGSANPLIKTSGVNDPVHHFTIAFMQSGTISGSTLAFNIELFDGATPQCSIVFRSDGAILLVSGAPNSGTTLATFTGAFPVINTWYAFEFEVVIHPTAGSFAIRKNGNTSNDFTASSLNTRPTSPNSYANKVQLSQNQGYNAQWADDFFWQSGATTGNWLGDLRCYTRLPGNDVQAQFSRSISGSQTQTPFPVNTTGQTNNASTSLYHAFVAPLDGLVTSITLVVNAGGVGNVKCAVFNDTGVGTNNPGAILATFAPVAAPPTGNLVFTVGTPFQIKRGVTYWVGFINDGAYSNFWGSSNLTGGATSRYNNAGTPTYALFPVATPPINGTANPAYACSWTYTVNSNAGFVKEVKQDGLATYVSDNNPGDADFYNLASLGIMPNRVVATTVRAYAQKPDVGTRLIAAQLLSGAATVASPSLVLSLAPFQWVWRTDVVDPNTGAAWTPAAVEAVQIGPKVIA